MVSVSLSELPCQLSCHAVRFSGLLSWKHQVLLHLHFLQLVSLAICFETAPLFTLVLPLKSSSLATMAGHSTVTLTCFPPVVSPVTTFFTFCLHHYLLTALIIHMTFVRVPGFAPVSNAPAPPAQLHALSANFSCMADQDDRNCSSHPRHFSQQTYSNEPRQVLAEVRHLSPAVSYLCYSCSYRVFCQDGSSQHPLQYQRVFYPQRMIN